MDRGTWGWRGKYILPPEEGFDGGWEGGGGGGGAVRKDSKQKEAFDI